MSWAARSGSVSLIADYETEHACGNTDGVELTRFMPFKSTWGCLPFGCSVLMEDTPINGDGWKGRTGLINKDFGAYYRQPPEEGRGCTGDACSPYFKMVCYKPEGLKGTLNDVDANRYSGFKTKSWHLAEPGITDCKIGSGRAPYMWECAEAANNIMVKYFPNDSPRDDMQWVDTRERNLDKWYCGRKGWGSVPNSCSIKTRNYRDKGTMTAYYFEPHNREHNWNSACEDDDINPDFQLICRNTRPRTKTPDMKDLVETEEMYSNYCDVVNSNVGTPDQGWCGTVPLERANAAAAEMKDWVHESECLKHRKCIAGFGDVWGTDTYVNCVDTVSPCIWRPDLNDDQKCATGLSYAQRYAVNDDAKARPWNKDGEEQAGRDRFRKKHQAWVDRILGWNVGIWKSDNPGSYKGQGPVTPEPHVVYGRHLMGGEAKKKQGEFPDTFLNSPGDTEPHDINSSDPSNHKFMSRRHLMFAIDTTAAEFHNMPEVLTWPGDPEPVELTYFQRLLFYKKGDGRSGPYSQSTIRKPYATHFGHCGGRIFDEEPVVQGRGGGGRQEEFIFLRTRGRRLLGKEDEEDEEDEEYEEYEEGEEDEGGEEQQSLQKSLQRRRLHDAGRDIEKWGKKAGGSVKGLVDKAVKSATKGINDIADSAEGLANDAADVANSVADSVEGIANKVADGVTSIANKAADMANTIADIPGMLWDQIYKYIPTDFQLATASLQQLAFGGGDPFNCDDDLCGGLEDPEEPGMDATVCNMESTAVG